MGHHHAVVAGDADRIPLHQLHAFGIFGVDLNEIDVLLGAGDGQGLDARVVAPAIVFAPFPRAPPATDEALQGASLGLNHALQEALWGSNQLGLRRGLWLLDPWED